MKIGKLPEPVLIRSVLKEVGHRREEVLVGPSVGQDCAVLEAGKGEVLVLSSDPITGTTKDIGSHSVYITANDLAASGADVYKRQDEVYTKSQSIRYIGDKSNANTDSALVATKRSLIFNELNKELYRKFFMNRNELQACKDGYIYIHDQSARLDTMNCCLFDVANVLRGGFEMGNVWYNEPKTLDTAFDAVSYTHLKQESRRKLNFAMKKAARFQRRLRILPQSASCNKWKTT